MAGAKIFVSYSHRDARALDRLRTFVRPLEREGLLTAWSDASLTGGDVWRGEIAAALESATTLLTGRSSSAPSGKPGSFPITSA